MRGMRDRGRYRAARHCWPSRGSFSGPCGGAVGEERGEKSGRASERGARRGRRAEARSPLLLSSLCSLSPLPPPLFTNSRGFLHLHPTRAHAPLSHRQGTAQQPQEPRASERRENNSVRARTLPHFAAAAAPPVKNKSEKKKQAWLPPPPPTTRQARSTAPSQKVAAADELRAAIEACVPPRTRAAARAAWPRGRPLAAAKRGRLVRWICRRGVTSSSAREH
jgi:hypothetical protein